MATISYDEIELKLTSSATLNGIDKAIKALESLKDASKDGMSGLGEAANNINSFVASLRSVNKDIVDQYKSLADSISKIAKSGNSAKKVMEKMGASIKDVGGQASQPIVQQESIDNAEHMSTSLIPVVTALKNVSEASQTATDDMKKLRSAFESAYKLGSDSQKGLPGAEKDGSFIETTYREIGEVEAAYDKAVEHLGSVKAITDHIELFTPEDENRLHEINKALGYMHDHLERDRGIAKRHGDTDFMAQIDDYAKRLDVVTKMFSSMNEIDLKAGLDDTYQSIMKLAQEYGNISQSHGTAFRSDVEATESFTMSLKDLNTALEEIRANGGINDALKANNAQSFIDLAEQVEEQGREAAEAMDKVAGSTRIAKTEEELFQEEVQAVMAEIEKVNGVSNSYLRNVLHFNPEAIYEARYQLTAMKEAARQSADGVKEIGKEAKKAQSPIEKIASRLKNILMYRVLRNIISGMGNAIKEGFTNLEQWDRKQGNTGFAEAMDRARESLLVLKNSLAVVGAPFLEGLISVLQQVASWAMTAANAISRFFAILGGKSTYRAVVWADSIADSEKKAGGAAKKATDEFKKQLMAFDEINNISAQNDSGSGGGGGGGASAKYTEMFEERDVGQVSDIEGKLAGVVKWLKQIGKFLSKGFAPLAKIKDTVQEVWNKVKETASLVASAFKKPIETIVFGFRNVISAVSSLFESIISAAGSVVKSVLTILDAVIKVGDEFGVWQTLANWIKGAFDVLAGAIQVVAYWIKTAGYYLEYVATLAGEAWKLIMGKGSIEEFKRNMEEAKNTLEGKVLKATNDLAHALNNTFNRKYYLKTVWDEIINRTVHVNEIYTAIGSKGMRTVEKYAEGGIVPQGQLFIAREAGAELVGNVGGHTAVMNNQDIVNAVSAGVASAVASVMGNGSNVTVTLEGDAKGIFKVVQKEGRAYSARTGQPALA